MASVEMASVSPGNTKAGLTKKARNFMITLNDPMVYDGVAYNLKLYKTLSYLLAYREKAPTTGHEHIHIFAHFKNMIKISLKKLCGGHLDICKGTPQQIINYISKNRDLVEEWGTKPKQGGRTIKEVKEMTPEDRDNLPIQYFKIIDKINKEEEDKNVFFNMLDEIASDNLKAPTVFYITGGTGKGKTYTAYKKALALYDKKDIGKLTLKNDFIDIINDTAKCFVIEEFRPSQIKASDFLQLTDKYGYRANIKGSFKTIRPECLIICSIIHPKLIYREEVNKQFLRRITEIIDLGHEEQEEETEEL